VNIAGDNWPDAGYMLNSMPFGIQQVTVQNGILPQIIWFVTDNILFLLGKINGFTRVPHFGFVNFH